MYKLFGELAYRPGFWLTAGVILGLLIGAAIVLGAENKLPKFTYGNAIATLCVLWAVLIALIVTLAIQMPFLNFMTELHHHEILFGKRWQMERYNVSDAIRDIAVDGAGTYYLALSPGCFETVDVSGVDGVMWRYIPDSLTNTQYEGGVNGFWLYTIPVPETPATVRVAYGDSLLYVFQVNS